MKRLLVLVLIVFNSTGVYCQISEYFSPLIIQNDTIGFKDLRGGDFVIIKVWADASNEIFDEIVQTNKRNKVQRASAAERIQVEFLWEKDSGKKKTISAKQGTAKHLINAGNSMRTGLLVNIIGTAGGTVLLYTGQPVLGSIVISASGLISTIIQFYTASELTNAGLEMNE